MSTTFAPPSGQPRLPDPWSSPAPDLEPAKRRRSGALAVAAAALVALGVGAFAAVGSSEGDTLPAVEPFSLAAAAQNAIDARSVEFDLTVSAGDLGDVTVAGAVDNETELVSVSTDLSRLLSLDAAMPTGEGGGDGSVEMLFDASTGMVYISADLLGGLLPADSAWVSADLGVLAEKSGTSLEEMQNELFVDPAESARLLLDSDNVVEVGSETIDGVDTVQYEVTVDLAAAIAASPQAGSRLGEAGVDLPDAVTYDVWVTSDNQLRRASFDVTVADQTIAMVLNMRPSDQPLAAQVPADSFDITGLLDW